MKAMKDRDKRVELLKKELKKIHSRSTILNIRRSVRKAGEYLNDVVDFILQFDSEILAVQSLKNRNRNLARTLQSERVRSSRLLQEKNELQAEFQEMYREKQELKKEKSNLEQLILSDLEEFKSALPNIVELSEHYSKRLMKYETFRKNNALRNLPRSSFGLNSNQPVSTVNPMVQGYVIQKPTINVRRVPLPNETRGSMFEYVNINSPILEESETDSPANTTNAERENAQRSALNVSNRSRAGRRSCAPTAETSYYDDTADDDERTNVHLEPVVRLEDVTRMLQHSSIRMSESPKASPKNLSVRMKETASDTWSPEVLVPKISVPMQCIIDTSDNPLEGCSWMNQAPSPNILTDPPQPSSDKNTTYIIPKKSYSSPLLPKSPLCCKRDSSGLNLSKRPESTPKRELDENLVLQDDDEDTGVVSSSNIDDSEDVFRLGITHRKRIKTERTRRRNRSSSSEIDEDCIQNNIESTQRRLSLRPRRSTRLSKFGEQFNLTAVELESVTISKLENTVENAEKDETCNDSEISRAPQHRKKRKENDSKRDLSVSNVSNSDLEDSSRQHSRPTRNRGNASLKEPSLRSKLRRK